MNDTPGENSSLATDPRILVVCKIIDAFFCSFTSAAGSIVTSRSAILQENPVSISSGFQNANNQLINSGKKMKYVI